MAKHKRGHPSPDSGVAARRSNTRETSLHVPLPAVLMGLGLLAAPAASQAGTAIDDHYTTPFNTTLSGVTVLSNDVLTGNTTAQVFLAALPTHGTASLQTNGALTYTPAPGFQGQDTFSYQLANGNNTFANVSVTVSDPVVAVPALAPAGLAALSAGLAGLAALRRRRKR
jgi:hypothetical protein